MMKLEFSIYALSWGLSFVSDPDIIIEPQSSIEINGRDWEIFNSPGHSSDHITLYDRDNGILFSGDNVMKSINVWLGPPKSDLEQYETSLQKMLSLENLKIILPAHGAPVTETYKRLNEIIEWRKKRTADVLALLKDSFPEGFSLSEISDKLYPDENRIKKNFAEGWIDLTLKKFEKEKIVVNEAGFYYYHKS